MATHDKQGRAYAKLSELKAGDEIELDDGFTCASAGKKIVKETPYGLAFDCSEGDGSHTISGQADDGEHCIGIYKIRASKPTESIYRCRAVFHAVGM